MEEEATRILLVFSVETEFWSTLPRSILSSSGMEEKLQRARADGKMQKQMKSLQETMQTILSRFPLGAHEIAPHEGP